LKYSIKQCLIKLYKEQEAEDSVAVPNSFLDRIKTQEGFNPNVYRDSEGYLTAGWGHKLTDNEIAQYQEGDSIDQKTLDAWLAQDSSTAYAAAAKQAAELGQSDDPNFIDALADVNYQLGTNWNQDHRNTWSLMKQGKYKDAADEVTNSLWVSQTPKRVQNFQQALLDLDVTQPDPTFIAQAPTPAPTAPTPTASPMEEYYASLLSGSAAVTRAFTEPVPDFPAAVPTTLGGKFARAVEAGGVQLESDVRTFGAMANYLISGDEEQFETDYNYIRLLDQTAGEIFSGMGTFEEFIDAPTFGKFIEQVVKGVGQFTPMAVSSIASAGTGAIIANVGKGVLGYGSKAFVKKEVKDILKKQQAGKTLTAAEQEILDNSYNTIKAAKGVKDGLFSPTTKAGLAFGAFGQEYVVGSSQALKEFDDAEMELTPEEVKAALALGIPQAVLGTLSEGLFYRALTKQAAAKVVGGDMAAGQFLKELAKGVAVQVGKSGVTEGITETLQEGALIAQRFAIDPTYSEREALLRAGESAFIGTFAGGARAAPTSVIAKAYSLLNTGNQIEADVKYAKDTGVSPDGTPQQEPLSDIKAQFDDASNINTGRDSVFIPGATEESLPKILQDAGVTPEQAGQFITIPDPNGNGTLLVKEDSPRLRKITSLASKFGLTDDTIMQALQMSQIQSPEHDQVLLVTDEQGNHVFTQTIDEAGKKKAIANARRLYPTTAGNFKIDTFLKDDILKDKQARVEPTRQGEFDFGEEASATVPPNVQAGDEIDVFDIEGNKYKAKVSAVSKAGSIKVIDQQGKEVLLNMSPSATLANINSPQYKLQSSGHGFQGKTLQELTPAEIAQVEQSAQNTVNTASPTEGAYVLAQQDLNAINLNKKEKQPQQPQAQTRDIDEGDFLTQEQQDELAQEEGQVSPQDTLAGELAGAGIPFEEQQTFGVLEPVETSGGFLTGREGKTEFVGLSSLFSERRREQETLTEEESARLSEDLALEGGAVPSFLSDIPKSLAKLISAAIVANPNIDVTIDRSQRQAPADAFGGARTETVYKARVTDRGQFAELNSEVDVARSKGDRKLNPTNNQSNVAGMFSIPKKKKGAGESVKGQDELSNNGIDIVHLLNYIIDREGISLNTPTPQRYTQALTILIPEMIENGTPLYYGFRGNRQGIITYLRNYTQDPQNNFPILIPQFVLGPDGKYVERTKTVENEDGTTEVKPDRIVLNIPTLQQATRAVSPVGPGAEGIAAPTPRNEIKSLMRSLVQQDPEGRSFGDLYDAFLETLPPGVAQSLSIGGFAKDLVQRDFDDLLPSPPIDDPERARTIQETNKIISEVFSRLESETNIDTILRFAEQEDIPIVGDEFNLGLEERISQVETRTVDEGFAQETDLFAETSVKQKIRENTGAYDHLVSRLNFEQRRDPANKPFITLRKDPETGQESRPVVKEKRRPITATNTINEYFRSGEEKRQILPYFFDKISQLFSQDRPIRFYSFSEIATAINELGNSKDSTLTFEGREVTAGELITEIANAAREQGRLAKYLRLGDRDVIFIDTSKATTTDKVRGLYAVAHELGHSVFLNEREKALNTPKYKMLMKAFEQDKARIEAQGSTKYQGKFGFEEWFADQTASWLVKTQAKNGVDSFFKRIYDRLKKIFDEVNNAFKNRFVLNATFEEYINEVIATNRQANEGNQGLSFEQEAQVRDVVEDTVNNFKKYISPKGLQYIKNQILGILRYTAPENLVGDSKKHISLNYLFRSAEGYLRSLGAAGKDIARKLYSRSSSKDKFGYLNLRVLVVNQKLNELYSLTDANGNPLFENESGEPDLEKLRKITDEAESNVPTEALSPEAQQVRTFLEDFFSNYISLKDDSIKQLVNFFPRKWNIAEIIQDPQKRQQVADLLAKYNPKVTAPPGYNSWLAYVEEWATTDEDNDSVSIDSDGAELSVGMTRKRQEYFKKIPNEAARRGLGEDGEVNPDGDAQLLVSSDQAIRSYLEDTIKKLEYEERVTVKPTAQDVQNLQRLYGKEDPRVINILDTTDLNRLKDLKGWRAMEVLLARIEDPAARQGARKAVEASLGKVGMGMSPIARKINSWALLGNMVTLLTFAMIASLPDLAGPIIRSRNMTGLNTIVEQMSYYFKNKKAAERFARDLGVVTHDAIETMYINAAELGFMTDTTKKFARTFFRATFLEQFTKFTRVFASLMGQQFVLRLAQDNDAKSLDYLAELGVTREQVLGWQNNGRRFDTEDGKAVQLALGRFVEESIVRPNAAERPVWASNPYTALIWQLKSFFYAYGKNIVGGIKRQMQNSYKRDGNLPSAVYPMLLAGMFLLPLTAVGLELRELIKYLGRGITPGGKTFEDTAASFRTNNMNWGEYMQELLDRSGIYGPLALLFPMMEAPKYGDSWFFPALGPTAERFEDVFIDGEFEIEDYTPFAAAF
jgi:GH24 family phage-related lysozyme (muramidase)